MSPECVTIGQCTLLRGDAMEVLQDLEPVDVLLTDPPYSSGARRDAERQVRGSMLRSLEDADWFSNDSMTAWGYTWFMRGVLAAARPLLPTGAHLYLFSDWRQTPNVYAILESCGYRVNHCLVWAKPHYGMGAYWRNQHEHIVFASCGQPNAMRNHGMGSVLTCPAVPSMDRRHPTEKPVSLLATILNAIPGQRILDPFMGSGSTGVACALVGRAFVGVEVDERHFQTACRRLDEAHRQLDLFPLAPPARPPAQERLPLEGVAV